MRLAGPVVLSRVGIMAMGLVDTVVVGRHSGVELGYLALAWAPTGIVLTTSIGLLSGVQVQTSQMIGEGRARETGAVLRRGMVYSLLIGDRRRAATGGSRPVAAAAQRRLGGSRRGRQSPVLIMLSLSLIPILVGDAGVFWLEAHGRAVPGAVVMWASNVINLALNLWLVPGTSGFAVAGGGRHRLVDADQPHRLPDHGRRGDPAVARGALARRAAGATPKDREASRRLRRIGYATAMSYFVEAGAFQGMTFVAGWLGATAVAAWAIVINAAALIFMLPLGLATAAGVLVGRAYGAGDRAGVRKRRAARFRQRCSRCCWSSAPSLASATRQIAAGYTTDPAVAAGRRRRALLLSCLFYIADGLQVVGAQSLRAQNDIWVPTATHFFSYLAVMVPLCVWFSGPLGWGVDGIIGGVIVASLVSAAPADRAGSGGRSGGFPLPEPRRTRRNLFHGGRGRRCRSRAASCAAGLA